MSISCDCSNDGGESPNFFAQSFHIAKKEHRCCECGEIIKSGQRYNRDAGTWDGEFRVYKTCMPCYEIRNHYCPDGWIYGELMNAIGNCLGFNYTDPEDDFYKDEDDD